MPLSSLVRWYHIPLDWSHSVPWMEKKRKKERKKGTIKFRYSFRGDFNIEQQNKLLKIEGNFVLGN